MANSHVPKFGNWENDDIPYTAYFDDARKDKPVGNVRINPNDPEENPEAFMAMMQRRESSRSLEGYNASHDHNLYAPVLQAAAAVGQPQHRLMKSTSTAEKSCHTDDHTRHRERRALHKNTTTSTNHKSPTSESGGDQRTSSDYSLLSPPNQGRSVRSDDHYKKKSATTSSGSRGSDSSSSASEQAGHRGHRRITSNNSSDHQHHHRAASIPKFGSWDVNDPKTGEGFSIIFDKMKEEKHSNAAAKAPAMSPPWQPSINNHKDQRDQPGIISSCISKICCCCMSSSGSK